MEAFNTMKAKFITLFLAIFLLSFGTSFAQEVSVDNIDGLMWHNQPDSIIAGSTYTFNIRFNNNTSVNISGFTIPFHVYSPDGATWTTTTADTTGLLSKSLMDGGLLITYPDDGSQVNGSGADTLTFGGFVFFNPGLPPGFNEVSLTIQIGPITDDALMHGKTICLDSVTFPQNAWKWVEKGQPDIIPSWDGPHCYTVVHELTDTDDDNLVPHTFGLEQNYPNPFNPTTRINFSLATRSEATLTIYNITGQKVKEYSSTYEAGPTTIEWDASNVSSGVYFYKLVAGDFTDTKKMMLLK